MIYETSMCLLFCLFQIVSTQQAQLRAPQPYTILIIVTIIIIIIIIMIIISIVIIIIL